MSKTVAFIYGFTEGEWHGKRFRRLLRERGYEVVYKLSEADVIIAHSGGVYRLPDKLQPGQRLVLIDPPYWPERPVRLRAVRMVAHMVWSVRPGNAPFYQLHKTAWNFRYLVHHAELNRAMVRRANTYDLEQEITHPGTVLVHNATDPWLTPDLDGLQLINPSLRIVHIAGGHDDCWVHPERYINLLQSEL